MSVCTAMLALALLAVLLGLGREIDRLGRRRDEFLNRMRLHASRESSDMRNYQAGVEHLAENELMEPGPKLSRQEIEDLRRRRRGLMHRVAVDAEYNGRMKRKYEEAAAHPWQPVVPDPPPPPDL